MSATRYTTANVMLAPRTCCRSTEARAASARLTTRANTMTPAHRGEELRSCSTIAGIDCSMNAKPNPAAERAIAVSTRTRLSGLRTTRPRGTGASRAGETSAIAVGVEPRQDAVFDGAAQQIDLGRRRTSHLDVLGTDAVEVLARRRVADAELLGRELEREAGCVQVQDLALATPEF